MCVRCAGTRSDFVRPKIRRIGKSGSSRKVYQKAGVLNGPSRSIPISLNKW